MRPIARLLLLGGAAAAGAAAMAGARPDAPPPPPPPPAESGAQIFHRCYACHSIEPGENTPAGPSLHGVVGRPIAAMPGFDYSPALRELARRHGRWTPELLDRFITDPAALAPGTEMGFIGLADPIRRRILIDWLASRAPPHD